jgi:precorrin-8X/cobalt-precorrin-8 methylmutase
MGMGMGMIMATTIMGGNSRMEYLRDPEEIYRRSFAAIREVVDLTGVPEDIQALALRVIHSTGDPAILPEIAWSKGAGEAGRQALKKGAPIFADCAMVAAGIIRPRLSPQSQVICTLYEPGVADLAKSLGTTRSAAAVDLWRPRLDGAVAVIGNAPTALFRLLELIEEGARPALVLGFPVGFIGAAESKQALIDHAQGVPYVTLRGRRGGSPIAASALNALSGGEA